jgi:hypothetical protein
MKKKINDKSDWVHSNGDRKTISQSIFRAHKRKNDFSKNFFMTEKMEITLFVTFLSKQYYKKNIVLNEFIKSFGQLDSQRFLII